MYASKTKSNARVHLCGGRRRSAASYATEDSGKRRLAQAMAVAEMSKATTFTPQPATSSASSPRPQPTTIARLPRQALVPARLTQAIRPGLGTRSAQGTSPASPEAAA